DGIRDFHVTGVQTCALPISFGGFSTLRSMIWSRACMATLACCQRLITAVICDIGAIMREARMDAATREPTLRSPFIAIGAPKSTTQENTAVCTLWVQTPRLLAM